MSLLSNDDWLALVDVARRVISAAVLERSVPNLPSFTGALSERRGAFVSLYRSERLRGCVGQVEDPGPLGDVVARSAISAALNDDRFPPVGPDEIDELEIEISVLTVLERIAPLEIVVGRHGLLVAQAAFRGLLLPQVASERNWTSLRFLEEACVKAGLATDAWRDPLTQIFGFTAEIYSERKQRELRRL